MKKEVVNEWIKITAEINNCLDELKKLNEEKSKLLEIVETNPTEEILNQLKQSEEKFESLVEVSEEIKLKAKKLKEMNKKKK